jgi:TolB-like protein/DNA-binding winged helix-turn-helix (wHTH) protein/tetratricopeptide (TPR) repeat protein
MRLEETPSALQIGEWIVHPWLDCIVRDGVTHKLEPRAMRLLLCLAESPGAVVSLDGLLAEVWPDVVVGSASVYQTVSQLRKSLGDVGPSPTYIATVARKGYRLVAAVQRIDPGQQGEAKATRVIATAGSPAAVGAAADGTATADGTAKPRRGWLVAGVVVALAVCAAYVLADKGWLTRHSASDGDSSEFGVAGRDETIAVLPFADMSENKDQEYFSDGLAEELIEQLGSTPGLKVIARTSSFSFKGKSDDIPTIAHKLQVANVLEGSVRRVGDHLRVSTQLIRAESGQLLWSETFDRQFHEVFAIQDEIAAAVVLALKVKLNRTIVVSRGHGTANAEAYDAYLLGRQLFMQGTVATWRESIDAYRTAIRLDPHYAEAYADLALSQYYLADQTGDRALGKAAEEAVQKAIEMEPSLASGYAVRGTLRYLFHYDWVGAESDLRQALALEPTNSRVLSRYGNLLSYLGRTPEAIIVLRKAIDQDPLQSNNWHELGIALAEGGDHAAAYEAFRHAIAIRPGDNFSKFHLARLQLVDGNAREALETFNGIADEEFRYAGVAMAAHTLGDAQASERALDKLIAIGAQDAAYQIAEVHAWRAESDQAFEWLERAYRQQDGGLADLKGDLQFASLHSDPRYTAMLRKLNFPP